MYLPQLVEKERIRSGGRWLPLLHDVSVSRDDPVPNRFLATPKIPQKLARNIAIDGGMLMPVDFCVFRVWGAGRRALAKFGTQRMRPA